MGTASVLRLTEVLRPPVIAYDDGVPTITTHFRCQIALSNERQSRLRSMMYGTDDLLRDFQAAVRRPALLVAPERR